MQIMKPDEMTDTISNSNLKAEKKDKKMLHSWNESAKTLVLKCKNKLSYSQSRRCMKSSSKRRPSQNKEPGCYNCAASVNKSKLVLPQLNRIRPSTASGPTKQIKHLVKESLIAKKNNRKKPELKLQILEPKKLSTSSARLRPGTAPALRVESKVSASSLQDFNQDDGSILVGVAQFRRHKNYCTRKDTKQKKRSETYAINTVMKNAFLREYHFSIKQGQNSAE